MNWLSSLRSSRTGTVLLMPLVYLNVYTWARWDRRTELAVPTGPRRDVTHGDGGDTDWSDRQPPPPYGNVANVNVPAFIGAGAVSVNVLDVAVFSPSRARFVP